VKEGKKELKGDDKRKKKIKHVQQKIKKILSEKEEQRLQSYERVG
jgi:hypothetical protein